MHTEKIKPESLSSLVNAYQAGGRYVLKREEALRDLGISEDALRKAAQRLVGKGRIIAPRRGFFVIVPLEYQSAGGPPPPWFIDELMRFHGCAYYVGLLSAAALHGAAHQQPQEFQVVASAQLRPATVGRARLRFFTKRHMERTPTVEMKTETGSMRVSTPEATALDLVRYAEAAGHLSHVATVLSELKEKMDGQRLVDAAQADIEFSNIQRLGFLLDRVGATDVAEPLARWLSAHQPRPALLRPDRPGGEASTDPRWSLLVNDTIETDE
ncbi:MAG: type IV toxin-antitoxin system AbiEi family antitoxin domain-containing protein [Myxococcaceae bacterium]